MRILKWVFGALAVLIVAFVAIGMLLPREVTVERQAAMNVPAEKIFPHVNNLKATEAWSPWLGIDPYVQTTYSEIAEGVGAKMSWTSEDPQVGNGAMEVIESVPNKSVKNALDFGDMGTAIADYKLVEEGGVTTVTWGLTADMGVGPVGRWMGLMMDDWVGADYERGLDNLKALVEQ
ncbi:MAG: SRPBCC family protein [Pseudomonadota bacterium]